MLELEHCQMHKQKQFHGNADSMFLETLKTISSACCYLCFSQNKQKEIRSKTQASPITTYSLKSALLSISPRKTKLKTTIR